MVQPWWSGGAQGELTAGVEARGGRRALSGPRESRIHRARPSQEGEGWRTWRHQAALSTSLAEKRKLGCSSGACEGGVDIISK